MKHWAATLGLIMPLAVSSQTMANEPVTTVTTIGMIADVASEVSGSCADVSAIMGPGVDPHLYQASAQDVATLQQAELIFYSGYSLEGQFGDVLERFSDITPTLAVAPSSIDTASLITAQDVYGIDPHLWMDASLWARTIPTLAETFIEQRPGCEAAIKANADRYAGELEALHDWIEASVASIPEAQRILVTAHDAFNYYGRAYGIEVAGIQGISTESETGVADIRRMTEVVVERQVPAVFIESTINPRTVQAVIDAARQKGHAVEIGGQLYSDAMGEDGTAGGTYIGMLHANTQHIVEALGGQLPPLPEALAEWAERWDVPTS